MKKKVCLGICLLSSVIVMMVSCSKDVTNWHSTIFNISGATVQLRYEVPLTPFSTIYCMSSPKAPNYPVDIYFDSVLKVTVEQGRSQTTFETDDKPHIIQVISNGDTLYSNIYQYGSHQPYFTSNDREKLKVMTVGDHHECESYHINHLRGGCVYRLSKEGVCIAKLAYGHIQILAIAPGTCQLQLSPDSTFQSTYDMTTITVK